MEWSGHFTCTYTSGTYTTDTEDSPASTYD